MSEIAYADGARAVIAETIKTHPIVLFMKGNVARPQCGFSAAVVEILGHHDVAVHALDVLRDPDLRHGIKTYSDWPTIPQLYIGGTFIGANYVAVVPGLGFLIVAIVTMVVRSNWLPGAIPDERRGVVLTRVHPRFVEAVRGYVRSGS